MIDFKDRDYIIINDDCLNTFKNIEDKSIDLILIDPPYNIGKDKKWDKWKTVNAYIEFMGEVFKECQRVLKDNGSFYFFHNDFLQIVELQNYINKNTNFVFKQLITWNKIHEDFKNYGYVQQRLSIDMMRIYYNGFTEYCLYYTFQDETGLKSVYDDKECFKSIKQYLKDEKKKSGLTNKDLSLIFSRYTNKKGCLNRSVVEHYFSNKQWCFPTEDLYVNVLQKTGYFQKPYEELRQEYEELKQEYEELRQEYEELRYTFNTSIVKENLRGNSNVWLYPPAKKQGHITPKPVEMLEHIIKTSSNEGNVILDCFMGSGSTGVACLNTGRKFIGIEKEEKYFNISKKRIEEAK